MPTDSPVTQLLAEWRRGDQDAGNRLFATTYHELRRLAGWHLQKENQTIQATVLVNELYLKLFAGAPVEWQDRAHFFAVAAQQMRRLLIDYARAAGAQKRGGNRTRLSLTEANGVPTPFDEDLLDLDDALKDLEALDPRAARVVELRYFAELTETEAAEVIGVSVATLKRDWDFARAWLLRRLEPR